ncbi:hypothetical protein [Actinomyces minihominis]|uniref:hypothetical protein n=1 Tax=Actinomyces minihominis TaxID=2002838 RepID=UPI000C06FAAA|nr:hypothetical protein [Actinomyces minihominis]
METHEPRDDEVSFGEKMEQKAEEATPPSRDPSFPTDPRNWRWTAVGLIIVVIVAVAIVWAMS